MQENQQPVVISGETRTQTLVESRDEVYSGDKIFILTKWEYQLLKGGGWTQGLEENLWASLIFGFACQLVPFLYSLKNKPSDALEMFLCGLVVLIVLILSILVFGRYKRRVWKKKKEQNEDPESRMEMLEVIREHFHAQKKKAFKVQPKKGSK